MTFADGFDGLPVPTPDGTALAWTSQRHGEKGAQIFMGSWNHDAALVAIKAAPVRVENSEMSR